MGPFSFGVDPPTAGLKWGLGRCSAEQLPGGRALDFQASSMCVVIKRRVDIGATGPDSTRARARAGEGGLLREGGSTANDWPLAALFLPHTVHT